MKILLYQTEKSHNEHNEYLSGIHTLYSPKKRIPLEGYPQCLGVSAQNVGTEPSRRRLSAV